MNDVALFWKYAEAFEMVYVSDDWSLLKPFFHEDAVYDIEAPEPLAAHFDGQEAVFAGLRDSVNNLDRRFNKRSVTVSHGPEMRDGVVWMRWAATYEFEGVPDLSFEGVETVQYRDGRICRLVDIYSEETAAAFQAWMDEHGAKLPPA